MSTRWLKTKEFYSGIFKLFRKKCLKLNFAENLALRSLFSILNFFSRVIFV